MVSLRKARAKAGVRKKRDCRVAQRCKPNANEGANPNFSRPRKRERDVRRARARAFRFESGGFSRARSESRLWGKTRTRVAQSKRRAASRRNASVAQRAGLMLVSASATASLCSEPRTLPKPRGLSGYQRRADHGSMISERRVQEADFFTRWTGLLGETDGSALPRCAAVA